MEKFVCIFGTESAVLFVPQNWWKDLHCCDYHEIHLQLVVSPLLKLEEDANAGGNEHLVLDPRHLCQVGCRASVLSLQPCCVLWWSHCLL